MAELASEGASRLAAGSRGPAGPVQDPVPTPVPAPSPWAEGASHRSHRRGRSGLLAGLRVALPGRRGAGPDGSGRGRHRFPLRPGDGNGQIDLRNTWQVVAGSLLVPLGVVLILMAWYGAAHTAYVQQQIPYLVSGSFAGLGCMVLGGLLYWAHWLYRIYDQADLHHQEELQALHRALQAIADRLDGSSVTTGGAEAPAASGAPRGNGQADATEHGDAGRDDAAPGGTARRPSAHGGIAAIGASDPPVGRFVATEGGTYYHLPTCPVVSHHGQGMRTVTPAEETGLEPCRICRPPEVVVASGPGRSDGPAGP